MLITLFFMMLFLGGSAGSTSGGMKLIRHLVILKNSALEFRRLMHPNAVLSVRINQTSVSSKILFNTMAFMIVYFTIFILGAVVMSISGEDFLTSIGSSASAIGNVGPGLGKVCPTCNYAGLTSFGKLFIPVDACRKIGDFHCDYCANSFVLEKNIGNTALSTFNRVKLTFI